MRKRRVFVPLSTARGASQHRSAASRASVRTHACVRVCVSVCIEMVCEWMCGRRAKEGSEAERVTTLVSNACMCAVLAFHWSIATDRKACC